MTPKSATRRDRGDRTGFTTGANAAAAARAAVLGLTTGQVPARVDCRLPNGQDVTFAIADGGVSGATAQAVSIKDAGDDPDVTHGARLTVTALRIADGAGAIRLQGGGGVGVVTREGLGLEVGGPAINPVPRQNIAANVRAVGGAILDAGDSLDLAIAVPDGERMARQTLNARLGILGGISILGTTGIVQPYSTASFRASIVQAIQMAARQGQRTLVLTTGGRTERCAMEHLPELPESCFVQMGDFVRTAFQTAIGCGMRRIVVGAMIGKLTKMAQGLPVTHAWRAELDRKLVADCARAAGAPRELVAAIAQAPTARFAAEQLSGLGLSLPFHRILGGRTLRTLRASYPGPYRLTLLICNPNGALLLRLEEGQRV